MIENKKLMMSVEKKGYVSALVIKDDPHPVSYTHLGNKVKKLVPMQIASLRPRTVYKNRKENHMSKTLRFPCDLARIQAG